MKKIISVIVILGLVVTGSIIGFKEYGDIQIEREQETLEFIKETYNEVYKLGVEYNEVEDEYISITYEQNAYRNISDDLEEIEKEIKKYEINEFKNNEEYKETIKKLEDYTVNLKNSINSLVKYYDTYNTSDMLLQNDYMRESNKLQNEILDFIEEKTLLNESEEI